VRLFDSQTAVIWTAISGCTPQSDPHHQRANVSLGYNCAQFREFHQRFVDTIYRKCNRRSEIM